MNNGLYTAKENSNRKVNVLIKDSDGKMVFKANNVELNEKLNYTFAVGYSCEVSHVIEDNTFELCKEDYENGCRICNDTSNDRYYRNQGYTNCPYCGDKL